MYPSICLSFRQISICLCLFQFICLSVCLSLFHSWVHLSLTLSLSLNLSLTLITVFSPLSQFLLCQLQIQKDFYLKITRNIYSQIFLSYQKSIFLTQKMKWNNKWTDSCWNAKNVQMCTVYVSCSKFILKLRFLDEKQRILNYNKYEDFMWWRRTEK